MKCEECGKEHDGSYGSGRFCSVSCKLKYVANKKGRSHICKYCNKEFETSLKLGAHVRNCGFNPNARLRLKKANLIKKEKYDIENPIIHVKLNCINCGKEYELELRLKQFKNGDYKKCCSSSCAHSYAAKFADPEKISKSLKNSELAKIANEKQQTIYKCKNCGTSFTKRSSGINSAKYCSLKCMKEKRHDKLAASMIARHEAGLLNKNYKSGIYHGIYCASSWELVFVIYCLDHNLNVKRCNKKFSYKYKGKVKTYFPDFEIDNTIYEIKGFESEMAKYKHKLFPQIKYLTYKDMKKYFDYAILKYGSNYLDLYDIKYFV